MSLAGHSNPITLTGTSLRRAEDTALLRGSAAFTADVDDPRLVGAAYAAFVRSPIAAGEIVSVDTSEAIGAQGVLGALTAADLGGEVQVPFALALEGAPVQPLLPASEVSFVGQVVAVVVAESPGLAADAAERVVVEYRPSIPVLDLDEGVDQRVLESTRFHGGSAQAAVDSAEVVVELSTWSPRQLPAAIEPRSIVAVWEAGRLMVWAATQTPHAYRANLAKQFELDTDDVRVVAPAVGGGFGGKVSRSAEEHLVPLMAQHLDRPVRWHENRSEYFATATQGRGERIDITLAGSRDGRFTALRVNLTKDAGAFPLVGVMLPGGFTTYIASGCYDIADVEFRSVAALTNRPSTSAYRGAGRAPMIGALERAVDKYATEVGIDPAELRIRNLIGPEQMPYTTPTGGVYDEADYPAALTRALTLARYEDLRVEQAARRLADDQVELGVGIACYNHMTMGDGGEQAAVSVHNDGTVTVVTGSTSQGHGHATTWAQIASDVLQIPPDYITVVEGDTDAVPTGIGAVGSRSLQTAGIAVHRASIEIVERAKELAAQALEAAIDDIVLADSGPVYGFHVVGTPARVVSWGELAVAGLGNDRELSCGDVYDPHGKNTYPSGTHVAVVELDTETGGWTLLQLIGVDDAGVVVNPMIVDGQLHGGMAGGIGQVLGEVMVYDGDGNPLTTNFADYLLPSADQLPSFHTEHAPTPTSVNPLGFKGVGESGTIGATAAVHNAVLDALRERNVDHINLPCTPQRVWQALGGR